MFTPQDYDQLVQQYDTSEGRRTLGLGDSSDPTGAGRRPGPLDPERADVWTNGRYSVTAHESGAFDQAGRGDRPPLPPTREAIQFRPAYAHDEGGGMLGGHELRANYGGHVIIRRMPNAGQAQGGMAPVPATPNQRRLVPAHWDSSLFIGGQ